MLAANSEVILMAENFETLIPLNGGGFQVLDETREILVRIDHGIEAPDAEADYQPYAQRIPIELRNLASEFTAEANARFREPLARFINDICSLTKGRSFGPVYLSCLIYIDDEDNTKIQVSFAVLVGVNGEEHLDTLSRHTISELFWDGNHLNEEAGTFAEAWGLDTACSDFVRELLEKHFCRFVEVPGLEQTEDGLFNYLAVLQVAGMPADAVTERVAGLIRREPANAEVLDAAIEAAASLIAPVGITSRPADDEFIEKVSQWVTALAEAYRLAFAKGRSPQPIAVDSSIHEAFELDIGCTLFFKRLVLRGLTDVIKSCSAVSFKELAAEVVAEVDIAWDFAREDGEPEEHLVAFRDSSEFLRGVLPEIHRYFSSEARWQLQSFIEDIEKMQMIEQLSPWYWMSPGLRIQPGFIEAAMENDCLIVRDMEGIPPAIAALLPEEVSIRRFDFVDDDEQDEDFDLESARISIELSKVKTMEKEGETEKVLGINVDDVLRKLGEEDESPDQVTLHLMGKGIVCDVYFIDTHTFERLVEQPSSVPGDLEKRISAEASHHFAVSRGFFSDQQKVVCAFTEPGTDRRDFPINDLDEWASIAGSQFVTALSEGEDVERWADIDGVVFDPKSDEVCLVAYTEFDEGLTTIPLGIQSLSDITVFRIKCRSVDSDGFLRNVTYLESIVGTSDYDYAESAILGIEINGASISVPMPAFSTSRSRVWLYRWDEDKGTHEMDFIGSKQLDW
ncbi:hypothetical protein NOR53_1731 [gamma proteobacterium NOR5-3]|nr:hypothetical protein NOR53_1731 [gamma proteobacterium NOR5-3]